MASAPTTHKDPGSLDPRFRATLDAVFADLRALGYQPVIASGWRSLEEQKSLYAKGYSQVTFSFHNAVDTSGRPAALAADVIDARLGYGSGANQAAAAGFWNALRSAAKARGLSSGGDFSMTNATWAKYGLGWDPSHVQFYPNTMLGQVKEAAFKILADPAAAAASAARAGTEMAVTTWRTTTKVWLWGTAIAGGVLLAMWALSRRDGGRTA
jgi:hypothetical protein